MGREIRKVPANWQHPKNEQGYYIPLLGRSFTKELADWEEGKKKWAQGLCKNWSTDQWLPIKEKYANTTFEEWDGEKPQKADYMPEWPEAEKTHMQLYETCTEGTPQTGVHHANDFEKLCEDAAENATTFGYNKATKQEWMDMLKNDFVHHRDGNILFM